MCYACVDYAATWGPHVGLYAREPVCEDRPSAEEVRSPTRAYLNERTQGTSVPTRQDVPGTSVHERMEMIRNALEVPPGLISNADMDRMEEAAAGQERLMRRLEEHHARATRPRYGAPLDPRQRHIVIARNYSEYVRFCNENGLRVRHAIHIRPDDRMADRHLMGLSNIAIHRVEGAMAEERVEAYLRHLVASDRAHEAEASRGREVERDAQDVITHGADGELRPAYRASPTGRDYAMPVQMQGMSAYHYVVDEAGHFMTGREHEVRRRQDAFSRFYGPQDMERSGEPGANYRPHGEIHTEPEPEGMHAPHHWASTLERSPYWYRVTGTLNTAAGAYKPEELDLDIRYV